MWNRGFKVLQEFVKQQKGRWRRMKYAVVAASVFAGDFFLKKHMEEQRDMQERTEILGGKLVLKKYHNRGAALNFMEKRPKLVKRASGGILLALSLLWSGMLRKEKNPGVLAGLSLALGGGASNLHDRIMRGYVVDYFSFRTPWKKLNQIVFNLSDMCIFLGCFLIIFSGRDLFAYQPE